MSRRGAAPRRRNARGVTLVEMMVGLTVGLFVSLIAISVFVSTRTLNVVNGASTHMGENARLAMEAMQDDLRSAGFQGCHDANADPPVSLLNGAAAAAAGFLDSGITGVAGHRGNGSSFAPALGTALAARLPAPAPNSDIVSVRVPVDNLSLGVVAAMPLPTAAPQVGTSSGNTLKQGDIVLIGDCKSADIFQVTAADPAATGDLTHSVGAGFTPGNASGSLQQRYRRDAAVYRLQTHHYYVAPSVLRPGTNSLWRFAVPCLGCSDNPLELAAGVDRLNVAWGIDTDADDSVNQYVAADAVVSWPQVLSARVQMLVATAQDGVAMRPQTITFAGAAVSPGDRRLRTVLTEVVTLRNRAP